MKKYISITLLVVSFGLISCSEDQESELSQDATIETIDIAAEASLDANYEDLDGVVEAGMETLDAARGRIERDKVLDCATISHDEENKTVTIDFGEGCEGPEGRVRAGKIIITYNQRRLEPGSFRQTTLENYRVDSVLIEGTRRVENISESAEAAPTFQVTLAGGKMTFPDETSATREADRTRTWIRASNPVDDEAQVTGTANGTKRDGVSYAMEIVEPLIYKRSCRRNRVFIPVSGIKQFTSGDHVVVVNYGDGSCDNEVTMTVDGGEPFTRTLRLHERSRR